LLTPYFPFGTPGFNRLSRAWRGQFLAEAAKEGLNIVMTVAWRFDVPGDAKTMQEWIQPYVDVGRVFCVEMLAPVDILVERNTLPARQASKNPYWVTEDYLRENCATHRYSSSGEFPLDVPHLVLDMETMAADAGAERIAQYFGLTKI
jgi:hypothetical protein